MQDLEGKWGIHKGEKVELGLRQEHELWQKQLRDWGRERLKTTCCRKMTATWKYRPLRYMQNNMKPYGSLVAYASQARAHQFLRERKREMQVSPPPWMPARTFAAETNSYVRATASLGVRPQLLDHNIWVKTPIECYSQGELMDMQNTSGSARLKLAE